MLTKKILSTTVALALTASVAMLAGCPTPTNVPSASDSGSASPSPSDTSSPSGSTSPSATVSATTSASTSVSPTASGSTTASPTASQSATSSSAPSSQTGGTTDIKERATFNGNIYDTDGSVLDGVTVSAKSIDAGVTWVGEAQQTANGSYVFQNAPVGVRIQIDAGKPGYASRSQTVVLKSNLTGAPGANVYDFGGTATNAAQYALQDEPEIVTVKVNAKEATTPGGIGKYIAGLPIGENLSYRPDGGTSVGISGIDNSKLDVELTFSEAMDTQSVQDALKVMSMMNDNSIFPVGVNKEFTLDSTIQANPFTWSNDNKTVLFSAGRPLLANDSGTEARYKLTFGSKFKDAGGKEAKSSTERLAGASGVALADQQQSTGSASQFVNGQSITPGGFIKYSTSTRSDYLTFSLKNDDVDPKLETIQGRDNLDGTDRVNLNFTKPLEVLIRKSPAISSTTGSSGFSTDANGVITITSAPLDSAGNSLHIGTITKAPTNASSDGQFNVNGSDATTGTFANRTGTFELINGSKSLLLKFPVDTFVAGQKVRVAINSDFADPAGNTISTNNSNTSGGITQDDHIKVSTVTF